jgi:hypothetical protein
LSDLFTSGTEFHAITLLLLTRAGLLRSRKPVYKNVTLTYVEEVNGTAIVSLCSKRIPP